MKIEERFIKRISKTFTRISKELNCIIEVVQQDLCIQSDTHLLKIIILLNAPLSVIAKQMNTSEKMLHSAYLDDDDILLSEEYNKMYQK